MLFNRLYGGRHLALRLGNAYGPRQDPHGEAGVVAIFCGQVARGETPAIYGDGRQTRDYSYVADVVDALIDATHYAGDEAVFNIGTGNATAVGGLLDVINAAAGTMIEPRSHLHEQVSGGTVRSTQLKRRPDSTGLPAPASPPVSGRLTSSSPERGAEAARRRELLAKEMLNQADRPG